MAEQRYVAGKRLKVGDGFIEAGEVVPDAAGWKYLRTMLRNGTLIAQAAPEGASDSEAKEGDGLNSKTKAELKEIAAELEIEGRGKLNKAKLIAAIEEAQAAKAAEEEQADDDDEDDSQDDESSNADEEPASDESPSAPEEE